MIAVAALNIIATIAMIFARREFDGALRLNELASRGFRGHNTDFSLLSKEKPNRETGPMQRTPDNVVD